MKAVRVRAVGRVQGVWFRGWAADEAAARNLSGWVRNRRDGSVEALFAGDDAAVAAMVALCRRGPPAARVDSLVAEEADPPVAPGFHQLPTD
ncbi:MAG: acylphosphatase [Rhodospirillales bacterium]